MDYDEQYSFSDVCSVVYEPVGRDARIWPNPVTTEATIYSPTETKLSVVDIYGRLVLVQTIQEGQNKVTMSDLSQGFYIFTLENGQRYKIFKE